LQRERKHVISNDYVIYYKSHKMTQVLIMIQFCFQKPLMMIILIN